MDIPALQRALAEPEARRLAPLRLPRPEPDRAHGALGLGGHMLTRRWSYLVPARGEPRLLVHAIELGSFPAARPGPARAAYASWQSLQAGARGAAGRAPARPAPGHGVLPRGRHPLPLPRRRRHPRAGPRRWASRWSPRPSWCSTSSAAGRPRRSRATPAPAAPSTRPRTRPSPGSARCTAAAASRPSTRSRTSSWPASPSAGLDHRPPAHRGGERPRRRSALRALRGQRPTPIRKGDLRPHRPVGPRAPAPTTSTPTSPGWPSAATGPPPKVERDLPGHRRRPRRRARRSWSGPTREERTLQGWQVDRVVRDHIAAQGFGDRFVHRTGHSIGVASSTATAPTWTTWRPTTPASWSRALAFSIEPGIYLPEEGHGRPDRDRRRPRPDGPAGLLQDPAGAGADPA